MHRALEEAGRYREALAALENAGGTAPYRDLVVDELATDRGRLLWRNARFDEAERVLEAAYADRCARLGSEHPDSLETFERLAANAHYQGRDEIALARFTVLIERLEGALGSRHLRTGVAKRNCAACLRDIGEDRPAWAMLADATRTIARHRDRDSPEAIATLKVEALLAVTSGGDAVDALRLGRTAVERASAVHGADHPLTAGAALTLASAQLRAERPRVAITVAARAAAVFEASYGRHPLLGLALACQAEALAVSTEVDAALATMQAADRAYRVAYPGLVLPSWGYVLQVLLDAERTEDALAQIAALLERPLEEDSRAYVISFRDAARS